MSEIKFYHAVYLDPDRCKGCVNCIKRCPTKAIRVRNGKAKIIHKYCIDCGQCIKHCPHHAKRTSRTGLEVLEKYKYKVALPAPALYSQFNNVNDINVILTGLKKLGFDDVFEVSGAAELVSQATRNYIRNNEDKWPIISTACPTIVRLIRVRFPELIEHMLPLNPPMEVAASLARQKAVKETGLKDEDIGIIFITPCPAKISSIIAPLAQDKSYVNGAIAIKDIYQPLAAAMKEVEEPEELSISGRIGVGWGISGGESSGLFTYEYLAADGIENVINVLEDLEDEKLTSKLRFIELNACDAGCVGGVLNVENPYIAIAKNNFLHKNMPVSVSHEENYLGDYHLDMEWKKPVEYLPVFQLSEDMMESMSRMFEREQIIEELPDLDCGACGAPTCKALAEDIVKGFAEKDNCIYLMMDKYHELRKRSQLFEEMVDEETLDEVNQEMGYVPRKDENKSAEAQRESKPLAADVMMNFE